MKLFKKPNTRRPRKRAWFFARASLVVAAFFFAAFVVAFYARSLWDVSKPLAIFVAVGFLFSAAVTPSVAPKLVHASKGAFAGLLLTCFAFGALDSFGVTMAFQGLENALTQAEHDDAVVAFNAKRSAIETRRSDAVKKRDAIELPARECWCPETKTADLAQWNAKRSPHDRDVILADEALADLAPPVRRDMASTEAFAILSALIQIALTVGLISLEAARETIYRRELDEYEAKLDADRVERRKRGKAQKRDADRRAKDAQATATAFSKTGLQPVK